MERGFVGSFRDRLSARIGLTGDAVARRERKNPARRGVRSQIRIARFRVDPRNSVEEVKEIAPASVAVPGLQQRSKLIDSNSDGGVAIGEQSLQHRAGDLGEAWPGGAADDQMPQGSLQDPRVRASLGLAMGEPEEPRLAGMVPLPRCDQAILRQDPHPTHKAAPHLGVRRGSGAHDSPHENLWPAALSRDSLTHGAQKAGGHAGRHVIHHLLEGSVEVEMQAETSSLQKEAQVPVHPAYQGVSALGWQSCRWSFRTVGIWTDRRDVGGRKSRCFDRDSAVDTSQPGGQKG